MRMNNQEGINREDCTGARLLFSFEFLNGGRQQLRTNRWPHSVFVSGARSGGDYQPLTVA